MDPLVSALVSMRRKAREALPFAAVLLLGAAVALHAMHPLGPVGFGALVVLLAALIAARIWHRSRTLEQRSWLDVEIGILLVVAAFAAVVEVDGALDGRCYPLVCLAVAIVSAFASPATSLGVVAVALGFELGLWQLAYDGPTAAGFGPHVGLLTVFAVLNMLTLRMEISRLRQSSQRSPRDVSDALEAQTDGASTQPGVLAAEQLLRSGVEEIHLSVLFSLRLLRESLGAHTAILLWLDVSGRELRISELVSDDASIAEGPFAAGDGIAGVVLSQRAPVCLADPKPSFLLPYYHGPCPVQAVCAVPVFERGALRGALVVDRRECRPFRPEERELVEQAARFASRAVENERVFVQLERTKVEQGKLYRAAESLGAAVTEQEVVEAGVYSAREIASVDFAAFTAFDPHAGLHQIRAVSGEGAGALVGQRFKPNGGLVSMALRNRHPLPYRGAYDPSRQLVFAKGMAPPEMPSLLVLPLLVHDAPLGTLVLGSHTAGAFNGPARGLLEVLASHLGVSLSNARMVRRLEEQATTDGLTGLLNKRAMHETAAQRLTAARRFGRPLSVMVTDIDLFKRINDTYGHDVGDLVIKELAAVHRRLARTTDAVARFGGEEFVTICEETDAEGALLLAERIRAEFAQVGFHARGETVHCTCSVGIATFPDAGTSWEELFKAADDAVYTSKRAGRDRATIWMPSGRRGVAA
jgi:two-component system cell cycle response regulator